VHASHAQCLSAVSEMRYGVVVELVVVLRGAVVVVLGAAVVVLVAGTVVGVEAWIDVGGVSRLVSEPPVSLLSAPQAALRAATAEGVLVAWLPLPAHGGLPQPWMAPPRSVLSGF